MVGNICVGWLNVTKYSTCSNQQIYSTKVQTFTFLPIVIIVGLSFLTISIRRLYMLRERINTFFTMSLCINAWLPLCLIYFGIIIFQLFKHDNAYSAPNILPLVSASNWMSYTFLGISFGPLIAAWLKLSKDHKISSRRRHKYADPKRLISKRVLLSDWPLPLIFSVAAFILLNGITPILMGFGGLTYNIAVRVYFGTWTVYLWSCSAMLVYGGTQIKRIIRELSRVSITPSVAPSASTDDDEKVVTEQQDDTTNDGRVGGKIERKDDGNAIIRRVDGSVNRVIGIVVLSLFIPASIGTLIHCVALEYIDGYTWTSTVIMCLYRMCASCYVLFWVFTFWWETSYRLKLKMTGRKSGSSSTTISGAGGTNRTITSITTQTDTIV